MNFDPTRHLTTESSQQDGVVVFTLNGECDMHTAPYVRLEVSPILQAAGRVVIDLHKVTFMDSAGYGMLVGLARIATDNGGKMCILAPTSGIVASGLKVLQVGDWIPIANTLEDALARAKD